jgi:hypothetical protein
MLNFDVSKLSQYITSNQQTCIYFIFSKTATKTLPAPTPKPILIALSIFAHDSIVIIEFAIAIPRLLCTEKLQEHLARSLKHRLFIVHPEGKYALAESIIISLSAPYSLIFGACSNKTYADAI